MVKDEGNKRQEKELKDAFEIRCSLRNTKPRTEMMKRKK